MPKRGALKKLKKTYTKKSVKKAGKALKLKKK